MTIVLCTTYMCSDYCPVLILEPTNSEHKETVNYYVPCKL